MSVVTMLHPTPHIVIFGRDQAGKPHASWFDQASAELATKAAALMNMRAVPVENEVLRELVGTLPRGRVFASGRAFTPFINGKLYGRLVELTRDLLGLSQNEAADEQGGSKQTLDKLASQPVEVEVAASGGDRKTGKPSSEPKGGQPTGSGSQDEQSKQEGASGKPAASPKPSVRPTRLEEIGLGSLVLATTGPTEGWYEAEVIGINGTMLTLKWCDYVEPTVVRPLHEVGFLPTPLR